MAQNMLKFDAFHEWQRIIESTEVLPLNEAFSSDYLRKFAKQESGSKWSNKFSKDFYKATSIPIDKITNEDFIILSNPTEWWTQNYSKNDSAVGFFVDDSPEFIKALNDRDKGKGAKGIGVILTIMRGNRGMWYGFAKDPGTSSRYKKSPTERYGILADEYKTASTYGWDGAKQKAKITRPNLEEIATKVYVLDLNALREKYSTTKELKSKRSEAKIGAVAMMSASAIRQKQSDRYQKILREKLDPNNMLVDLKTAMSDYSKWMSENITKLEFDPKSKSSDRFYQEMQVRWSNWDSDWSRPLSDMFSLLNKFMREWNDYLREQASVERLTGKLEDEDDQTKIARLNAEIDYYEGSYDRFVKNTIKYRDELRKYVADVKAITSK